MHHSDVGVQCLVVLKRSDDLLYPSVVLPSIFICKSFPILEHSRDFLVIFLFFVKLFVNLDHLLQDFHAENVQ